jgi:peptide chain release factor 1
MKPSMKAKLEQLDARLAELNSLLVQEEITKDMDQYRKLNREHAEISPVVEQFQLFLQAEADEQAALAMQADPEMKDFAEEEIKSAKVRMETMQAAITQRS